MNATANVPDVSALDEYYQNDAAKTIVNATLNDVSKTWGLDTSIIAMLLGADSSQEAQATAEAASSQVDPMQVVSEIDTAVEDSPIVSTIWGFFKSTFVGQP